jgi:7-alpha-hydroxysteroid dehydrogenase
VISERFRLDGQVAVITGAGRGIGAASAVALAEAGADVVVSSRTEEDLRAVAKRVEAVGRRAEVVTADLDDTGAAERLVAAATSLGPLGVVVNNVGGTMPRAFLDTSDGFLERAFHFNVTTAVALTRAAAPPMLEAGGGSVVNISSVLGRLSGRGYLAYGTAKAALSHATRLLAADLAPRIRVNALAVGSVATSALEVVVEDDDLRSQVESRTPLRRLGEPEEVAAAVLFLASAAGGYVTGQVLPVDGGIQAPNLDLGLPDL